jgi:hypothetical protein
MVLQGHFTASAKQPRAEHRRPHAERRPHEQHRLQRRNSRFAIERPDATTGDPELGKVADMQTQPTIEPTGSPVPGVIPEPARVHHDDTVAAHERLASTPTTSGTSKPASSPGRRNPARIVLARLLSTIRGDKYMVDAYPPAGHRAVAARAGDDVTQPGDVTAHVRVGVTSNPDRAAVASQAKEH